MKPDPYASVERIIRLPYTHKLSEEISTHCFIQKSSNTYPKKTKTASMPSQNHYSIKPTTCSMNSMKPSKSIKNPKPLSSPFQTACSHQWTPTKETRSGMSKK